MSALPQPQLTPKERLFDELKRRILTTELEPGTSMDESALGEEFGLSRTPVREVLRRLAGDGYVIHEDNRGAFVAPMTHKTLRAFFMTASPIYATIAALACDNRAPAQLEMLRLTQKSFRQASKSLDAQGMAYHNNQFHLIIGQMADNHYLWPSLQRLLIDHARIGQTFYRPRNQEMTDRMNTACEHHEQLIEAIEQRDTEKARTLAIEHWELSRDSIELFVQPKPLEIELS